jgi:hypothetical protein
MTRLIFLLMVLVAALTGCEGGDSNGNSFGGSSVIQWERSPQTVVFRAAVMGGDQGDGFLARNDIPLCTIYGDNRIVWTNELGDFDVQVLWDKVTDAQIQNFISFLTVSQGIFNYDAGYDLLPPGNFEPVREVITVNVNGRIHQTDSFSSVEWPLDFFERIVGFCKEVSRAPVLFEPTGAWLSVRAVEYDSNRPLQVWNSEAAGLDLAQLAQRSEPLWLTGRNLLVLWNILRSASPQILFSDLNGNSFEIVLEVPGVHPTAPPPPQ